MFIVKDKKTVRKGKIILVDFKARKVLKTINLKYGKCVFKHDEAIIKDLIFYAKWTEKFSK